jgi:hypothetical protein
VSSTYGVTPADVAAELVGLYPAGFAVDTNPPLAAVSAWISVEDLRVSVAVQNSAGQLPAGDDRLAELARVIVIERVIARVLRRLYQGNAPTDVTAASQPHDQIAADTLKEIILLGEQAVGVGEPVSKVTTSDPIPTRPLLVQDCELGPPPLGSSNAYGGARHQGQF